MTTLNSRQAAKHIFELCKPKKTNSVAVSFHDGKSAKKA
jgi:hypothetical protein